MQAQILYMPTTTPNELLSTSLSLGVSTPCPNEVNHASLRRVPGMACPLARGTIYYGISSPEKVLAKIEELEFLDHKQFPNMGMFIEHVRTIVRTIRDSGVHIQDHVLTQ